LRSWDDKRHPVRGLAGGPGRKKGRGKAPIHDMNVEGSRIFISNDDQPQRRGPHREPAIRQDPITTAMHMTVSDFRRPPSAKAIQWCASRFLARFGIVGRVSTTAIMRWGLRREPDRQRPGRYSGLGLASLRVVLRKSSTSIRPSMFANLIVVAQFIPFPGRRCERNGLAVGRSVFDTMRRTSRKNALFKREVTVRSGIVTGGVGTPKTPRHYVVHSSFGGHEEGIS